MSKAQSEKLKAQVPLVPGVQNVTYYPDTKTLQVFYHPCAGTHDFIAVHDLVRQTAQTSESTPSPKPQRK